MIVKAIGAIIFGAVIATIMVINIRDYERRREMTDEERRLEDEETREEMGRWR